MFQNNALFCLLHLVISYFINHVERFSVYDLPLISIEKKGFSHATKYKVKNKRKKLTHHRKNQQTNNIQKCLICLGNHFHEKLSKS